MPGECLQRCITCRMSVPIVICPWGELVTLLSVRHFTTMDVDDMETCAGIAAHTGLGRSVCCSGPSENQLSCRTDNNIGKRYIPFCTYERNCKHLAKNEEGAIRLHNTPERPQISLHAQTPQ